MVYKTGLCPISVGIGWVLETSRPVEEPEESKSFVWIGGLDFSFGASGVKWSGTRWLVRVTLLRREGVERIRDVMVRAIDTYLFALGESKNFVRTSEQGTLFETLSRTR